MTNVRVCNTRLARHRERAAPPACRILVLLFTMLGSTAFSAIAAQQPETGAGADVLLLEARRVFDALDYERAMTALDRVVGILEARTPLDSTQRQYLTDAYELRARSRFGLNDREGARADFRALLTLTPSHALAGQVSPNVVAVFAEVRKALIGTVNLTVTPLEAEVQLDGAALSVGGPISIVAGPHTITARQPGYRSISEAFSVTPDASIDLSLVLERVSATLNLLTVPADVEVLLDGVSRGTTSPGPPSADDAELAGPLGVQPTALSKRFVLLDIAPGAHTIELRKDCYVRSEQRVDVPKPADYRLPPVQLAKAVGSLVIATTAPGNVFIDGQARGAAPSTVDDVCEGSHVVEVRSAFGRYVERVEMRTGDKIAINATVRPAVAILSTTGLPEGLRGGPDLRLGLERVLQRARTLTVFAPAEEQVDKMLATEKLAPGWLSFDTARRPIGEAAGNITASARQDLSTRLARTLDVQGLASITVPSRENRADVLLTILAAGSGEPDTVRIDLDDPESIGRAIRRLDVTPPFFRPSAGLQVADVLDVAGAVVVSVEPDGVAAKTGIQPGDAIVSANGRPVQDGSAFGAVLAGVAAGDPITVEARDRSGATKKAQLQVSNVPQVVTMLDQTLLFNKLALDFRRALASPANATEESVVRLNLAVALMRLGNWSEANAELGKVRLPDGPGVSNGTVQYLLGLCREGLGQLADAEAAWRSAAAAPGALLTSEGPSVKDLAERKLADLARGIGSRR